MQFVGDGDTVEVVGKTRRGKNRVAENGSFYLVSRISSDCHIIEGTGRALLLRSVTTGWWGWIRERNDKDFEIVTRLQPLEKCDA